MSFFFHLSHTKCNCSPLKLMCESTPKATMSNSFFSLTHSVRHLGFSSLIISLFSSLFDNFPFSPYPCILRTRNAPTSATFHYCSEFLCWWILRIIFLKAAAANILSCSSTSFKFGLFVAFNDVIQAHFNLIHLVSVSWCFSKWNWLVMRCFRLFYDD